MDETFETEQAEILKGFCESYALMKVLGGDAAAKPPLEHLVSYVGGLLATKDAEIARLEARQITPEMIACVHEAQSIIDKKGHILFTELDEIMLRAWRSLLAIVKPDTPDAP